MGRDYYSKVRELHKKPRMLLQLYRLHKNGTASGIYSIGMLFSLLLCPTTAVKLAKYIIGSSSS